MLESEVKIGMKVRVVDIWFTEKKVVEEAVVKRLLGKNRDGKQIYEIEGDTMDRFHRPYKWISQRLAEDMERI